MTKILRILALLLLASPAFAQVPRTYTQPELDQMLAPVALYPDALLSQVLMAATYPVDVIQAARWSRANPGLQGDDAVRAVQDEDWDPSVKSLVAFPQLLARMDEQLDWMRKLGEAFLAQEPQVMDTVQQLRARAQAAGTLQSSEQVHVQQQGPAIVIQPAAPQAVYVPYYDPLVVYGTWWWPAYQPVVWAPWPGYARPYRAVGFWWGQPVGLSFNFFFGNVDWHRRHVRVVHPNAYYYRRPVVVNRTVVVAPNHRPQRPQLETQPQFLQNAPVRREQRQQAEASRAQQRQQVEAIRFQQQQRQQAEASRAQQRQQVRHEQRPFPVRAQTPAQVQPQARMPAAVAPPLPRAERQERREERRDGRQEQRHARGQKG